MNETEAAWERLLASEDAKALLRTIADHPNDATARYIWMDWLDEYAPDRRVPVELRKSIEWFSPPPYLRCPDGLPARLTQSPRTMSILTGDLRQNVSSRGRLRPHGFCPALGLFFVSQLDASNFSTLRGGLLAALPLDPELELDSSDLNAPCGGLYVARRLRPRQIRYAVEARPRNLLVFGPQLSNPPLPPFQWPTSYESADTYAEELDAALEADRHNSIEYVHFGRTRFTYDRLRWLMRLVDVGRLRALTLAAPIVANTATTIDPRLLLGDFALVRPSGYDDCDSTYFRYPAEFGGYGSPSRESRIDGAMVFVWRLLRQCAPTRTFDRRFFFFLYHSLRTSYLIDRDLQFDEVFGKAFIYRLQHERNYWDLLPMVAPSFSSLQLGAWNPGSYIVERRFSASPLVDGQTPQGFFDDVWSAYLLETSHESSNTLSGLPYADADDAGEEARRQEAEESDVR